MLIWPTMSGTSPVASLVERADHEAGHFVAARKLGLNFHTYWVTIRPTAVSGGACALGFHDEENITLDQWTVYLLAGPCAQALWATGRRYRDASDQGVEDLERFYEVAFQEEHRKAKLLSGTDLAALRDKALRHGQKLNEDEAWARAYTGIASSLEEIEVLSFSLEKETTLYSREAELVLAAHASGSVRDRNLLRLYRVRRDELKAVPEHISSRIPEADVPTPLYEDFDVWFKRELTKHRSGFLDVLELEDDDS